MLGTVVKMSTTKEINLLIKSMKDYHFERSKQDAFPNIAYNLLH